MVHSIVLKFEKIWLNHTLKIIRKSKSPYFLRERGHSSGTVNVKYNVIELNLYVMVHSLVLKFEKIWLSHTLKIIRKPKKGHIFLEKKGDNSEMENVKYTVIEFNRETKKMEGLIEKSEKQTKRRG